ncbi:FAD-dependent oxidoreductase [Tunturiibacter lichenicola]|uniref:FAD-dependent oxidoreductase n=1 Tax=Tunturiibacter lichenicola TaxID=2051959 RepID=UPI0021B1AEE8|nr:FAD-dependent oxidoreductase [Edaphobacter lichenicola]
MALDPSGYSNCLIVGAGPGGLAPLFAAAYDGRLRELLNGGVTVVEQGSTVGAGDLGRYAISSDSAAEAFLDVVMRTTEPALAALQNNPTVSVLAASIGGAVPLKQVATYLSLLGETMCDLVEASARGAVLRQHRALFTKRVGDELWSTRVRCELTGVEKDLLSRSVVLATGARQPLSRLYKEEVAGVPLLPLYKDKLMQSGDILSTDGLARVKARLEGIDFAKVVVVGGSTSAGSAASMLLYQSALNFGEGSVVLMHRRPLRIFYPSADEALAEGYTEFGPEDICPISGRVYRLAGFRLETREMIMRARGIAGRPPEPRLRLFELKEETCEEARRLLDQADIILAGLGYRPRALPVVGYDDEPISLMAESDAMQPMVDDECRVLDAQGEPIEGLYGIGLASGFVPSGALGGEQSFRGQANSLWLWQHDLGMKILDAVVREREEVSAIAAATIREKTGQLLPNMTRDESTSATSI